MSGYCLTCEDYNLQRKYLSKEDSAFLKQSGLPLHAIGRHSTHVAGRSRRAVSQQKM